MTFVGVISVGPKCATLKTILPWHIKKTHTQMNGQRSRAAQNARRRRAHEEYVFRFAGAINFTDGQNRIYVIATEGCPTLNETT